MDFITSRYRACRFNFVSIIFFLIAVSDVQVYAQSKDYYFPEVRTEIEVKEDGSFTVDEYRTYEFQGSFSWTTMWIPLRIKRKGYLYDIQIQDFMIKDEQGNQLRLETSVSNGRFTAKWYYRAANMRRTFHIQYQVNNGIFSYPEVSELYWQVIGEEWDKPTKYVFTEVRLPKGIPSRDDILVYGHGPLSGKSEIVDPRTARFTVSNLASSQHVEIRVVWPAGIVSGVPSNRHTLESIKAEEARFVQETIERAKRAQEEREKRQRIFRLGLILWGVWLIVGSLVWLPFFLKYWKRIGKDYRFDDIPEYYRELPSTLSPALVEVLLREGRSITPASFTATLFDLAQRGYIEIEDRKAEKKTLFGTKEEFETTMTCRKNYLGDNALLPYEVEFMEFLFTVVGEQSGGEGSKLELSELKQYFKKKPRAFKKWYYRWQKQIREESKKLQLIEPESIRITKAFMISTIPLSIIFFNPVLIVLSAILIPKMKRRTPPWARENEFWKAMGRFLDDFSSFEDLPPEAYRLWEHYLVFGIIFGNAKKILKMLPVILKDERAAPPAWYYGFGRSAVAGIGSISSMVQSIESMAVSIHQASTSAANYSSGSGGGFSSGGGSGGGGGGGSAG